MTNLRSVVDWVRRSAEADLSTEVICVREPWTEDAEARVVHLDEQGRIPASALDGGYEYFLEPTLVLEVLEALASRSGPSRPGDDCRLLIHYARHDAYPEWLYT